MAAVAAATGARSHRQGVCAGAGPGRGPPTRRRHRSPPPQLVGGGYPIIGVNTFLNPKGSAQPEIELARSTEEEKQGQLKRLADFQARNGAEAPKWLAKLRQAVIEDGNVFEVLVDAVRYCSLGQITSALYEVGGQYRRSM
nr:methylmalonyl-CoA mutase family protein [Aromatoleum aromaticum]